MHAMCVAPVMSVDGRVPPTRARITATLSMIEIVLRRSTLTVHFIRTYVLHSGGKCLGVGLRDARAQDDNYSYVYAYANVHPVIICRCG